MDKLQQAEKLLNALKAYGSVTDSQLIAFVQGVSNTFAQYRSATATINKDTKETLNLIVKQVNEEHTRILKDVNGKIKDGTSSISKEYKDAIKEFRSLIKEVQSIELKDGEDGYTPKKGIDYFDGEPGAPGNDGSPDTGEEIVKKINAQEDKIDASKIKNLPQPVINHIHEGGFNGGETPIKDSTGKRIAKDASGSWILPATSAGAGTVTDVSVVSANGLAGTVATSTTTPAITLTTTITGVLKGNGTAISAATSNSDYQAPITLTTTGSSGVATFNGTTLNVPNYSSGSGGITRSVVVTSGAFTMGATASTDYDYFVSGAHNGVIPTAVGNTNHYYVRNNHTASVTITTTGVEVINQQNSGGAIVTSTVVTLESGRSYTFGSDGTAWNII